MITQLKNLVLKFRRLLVIAIHLVLIAGANYAAFWLRFDGEIPSEEASYAWRMLPWLLVIRLTTFIPFGWYQGLWRYTGVWDLRNIIFAVLTSTLAFYALVHWG